MAITALPSLDRTDPAFKANTDTFFGTALPQFVDEANALQEDVNAKQATASAAATAASASASAASSAESTATTKAGEAADAKDAAETAAAAAAAALDSFDDRYLGVKAADPTVDNDGNPLTEGALYFRATAPKQMRVYDGAAWDAAYIPAGAYLSKAGGDMSGAINTARATVASHATAADIWAAAGNEIDFTGTVTVIDFPNAPQAGASRFLHCAGSTFTNNANIAVQGGDDYTTSTGDIVTVHAITVSTFRITVEKADGFAINSASGMSQAYEARSANTQLTSANAGKFIEITSGSSFTQTFDACASLGSTWWVEYRNSTSNTITFDPNGSETIGGQTTRACYPNEKVRINCDGTSLKITVIEAFSATISSTQAFVKPSGYVDIEVDVVSAGAGGNRPTNNADEGGGGGASGARTGPMVVSGIPDGTSITCTIGSGGVGATASNTFGTAGGASSFGSYITVNGGQAATTSTFRSGLPGVISGGVTSLTSAVGWGAGLANTSGSSAGQTSEWAGASGGCGQPSAGGAPGGRGGDSVFAPASGGGGGGTAAGATAGGAGGLSGNTTATRATAGSAGTNGTAGGNGTVSSYTGCGNGGAGGGGASSGTGGKGGDGAAPGGGGGGGGGGTTSGNGGNGGRGEIRIRGIR